MKILYLKYLLISVLLIYASHSSAQSFYFRSLTTKIGLPSNTVYQIKQDKKGFIWIATANGLARYDGRDFKIFNPESIRDKNILGICIDDENQVWFWNLKGQLFYIKDEKIYTPYIDDKVVISFIQDAKGLYWFIARSDGLYQLRDKADVFLIKKRFALKILNVEDEHILAGYGSLQYIFKEDKEEGHFIVSGRYTSRGYLKELFQFNILNNQRFTIETPKNSISIINKKGIFESQPFLKYESIFEGKLVSIYQDNSYNYWITTTSNTYIFDKNYQPLNNQKSILPTETVTYYFNDKEGNHWLSIKDKGIKIIPSINFTSNNFQNTSASVNAVFLNGNDLLVGTSKGKLIITELETNKIRNIQFEEDYIITGIHKSYDKDKIWIKSYLKSVLLNVDYSNYTDNIGNRLISYKTIWNKSDSLPLMIGEYNGVLKIPNKEIPYFISLNQAGFNVSWRDLQRLYKVKGITNRVYAIERIKNEFWFGSADGLYYYENDSVTLSQIPELENSWVTHIINQNDTVWIGTQTDGVFQVVNKKVINVFNEEQDSLSNRLVSNNCKSLVVEPNGIIWIGTNNGINKINTNTGANDLINNLDGLLSSDINALAINDESVFVATSEGLTSFDKNIQTKNKVPPPIYLSKFQIFDKDTILSNNYTLRHDQDNIRIHFTGVSFRSQGTFTYKYRMLPISETWIETQSNVASFPILNSGKYTFEAMAINEDGVESEEPINIKILVLTPYWQTWWFLGLIIILGLLGIYGYVWRLRKRLQKENDFQQKINELEMKALQAQMNPHFIFNVLNSIQHYLTINDGEQAMIYLAKFATLIRTIFDFSKNTSIVLTDEIEFLQLYLGLEKLRFKNKVNVNFEISGEIYTDDLRVPPLLIQPIIENAFKHGLLHVKKGNQKLNIHFLIEANWIKCIVEDNGIGREMAETKRKYKKHHSSGMRITEERLKMWLEQQNSAVDIGEINAFNIIDLKDENGNATGTRVEMILGENIEE